MVCGERGRHGRGKPGTLPGLRRGIGALPAEVRRTAGAAIHPARESTDTFWLTSTEGREAGDWLGLRPHLTGGSVRYMQAHEPPFRFVCPGRVYRNETADACHERAFYQYEVLLVDEKVPLTAGKFLVDTILDTTFGPPGNDQDAHRVLPFVEPGLEIDVQCQVCSGRSCRTCRQAGWLEIMPGGAPHPNVLLAGDLDPDRQGRPRSLRGLWLRPASQPGTALRGLPTTARSL